MTRWNGVRSVFCAALLGALAAACGNSNNPNNPNNPGSPGNPYGGGPPPPTRPPDAGQPPPGAPPLMVGTDSPPGSYLVDRSGRTLFLFPFDPHAGGSHPHRRTVH